MLEPPVDVRSFDLPRYLSVLPLFTDMSRPELERLAAGCQLRRLSRGDMVFRVGEPCEEFHVTVTGQVKLFAISPAGQEKVIELVGPGSSFAEALMFTDKPYIINAQALTDTLLLTVKKAAVVAEIEQDPRFAMRMLAGISRRLHGLVHDVEAYALHSGVQRVIGYLLRANHRQRAHAHVDHHGVFLACAARTGGGGAGAHRQARRADPGRAAPRRLPGAVNDSGAPPQA
jgi:CRP-like cAMP-binding protein